MTTTTIDNEFHILRPEGKETRIALGVWAYPEGVRVEVHSANVDLTLAEAKKLAADLPKAIELAESIVWDDDAPDIAPEIKYA